MFGRHRKSDVTGRGVARELGAGSRSAHLGGNELPPLARGDLACPADSEIPSGGASMTDGLAPAVRQRALRRILAEVNALQAGGTRAG